MSYFYTLASHTQQHGAKVSSIILDSSPQKGFLQIQEVAKKLSFTKPQKEFQSALSKLNKDLEKVKKTEHI